MGKFPVDAPITEVKRTLAHLGFKIVREGNHISLLRNNADGTKTSLTIPNHRRLKGSTLRAILTQAGISREEFLAVFEKD